MSDSNLPFRVPVQLTVGDQDAVQVFASFFAGFPAFNTTSLCILQSNVGASSAGLYVEENNRWKFACPFDDVCDMVVSGGSLSVYQDLVSEVAAPDNAIVYKNGIRVTATELEPGTTLWAAIVVTQSGGGSGGSGTVTSVGLTLPSVFVVSGSPVVAAGNLSATLATQAPARIFAGPDSGANAAPTFRALTPTDLPIATTALAGAIKAGTNVNIAGDGTISVAAVPVASSTLPAADGAAAIGTGVTFARADHVHPIAATIGTVKSVALTLPSIFAVAGSPVTTTGTLAATLATQAPALVFAGPVTGANAAPTFRALAATDLPIATAAALGVASFGAGLSITAGVVTASAAGAAPSAVVGTAAIAGTATTYMRSDGAPAVNQAMAPVWTGAHTFNASVTHGAASTVAFNSTTAINFVTSPTSTTTPAANDNSKKFATTEYVDRAASAGGNGTVTSVGLALPAMFTVSNSPVTAAGTLTATLAAQAPALVLSGPISGANATPTFRALAATDLPIATALLVGGVKGGGNINIAGDGTLSTATAIPAPATIVSPTDGVAAVGVAVTYARQDHVHATDATLAPKANAPLTGTTTTQILTASGLVTASAGFTTTTLVTSNPARLSSGFTVATLPVPTGLMGSHAFVTDGDGAAIYGAPVGAVAGTPPVGMPVFSNGTEWIYA